MVLNRIGDFGLVLGILIIFVNYKAVDYATVFSLTPLFIETKFNFINFNFDLLSVICFFLFNAVFKLGLPVTECKTLFVVV